jgi:hypothetical protein
MFLKAKVDDSSYKLQEQITSLIESHSLRMEEAEREHGRRARKLREQNQELLARVETLKDTLEGTFLSIML